MTRPPERVRRPSGVVPGSVFTSVLTGMNSGGEFAGPDDCDPMAREADPPDDEEVATSMPLGMVAHTGVLRVYERRSAHPYPIDGYGSRGWRPSSM